MGELTDLEATVSTSSRQSRIPFAAAPVFAAITQEDPTYPKAVLDYCRQRFLIKDRHVRQVYEELMNFAYWPRGFAPQNALEIGSTGASFSFRRAWQREKRP
jgi:hypothetical protein